MLENLFKRQSLIRILPEKPDDQVSGGAGDMGWEPEVDVDNASVGVLVSIGLEGGLANQELVCEDTQGPVVHPLAVGVSFNHLRGQIVKGSTHGGSPRAGGVD